MLRAFSRVRDLGECRTRDLRIGAAQRVVGAEFDDHALRPLGHRPVEPPEAARGGIPGYTGIDHLDLYPLVLQGLL